MLNKEKLEDYIVKTYKPSKEELLKYLDRLYYTTHDSKLPRKDAYAYLQHFILMKGK